MIQTEYIRSLNSNYERILLEQRPEEKKYQYCMIGRGGIKGLLPCSLRYLDGLSYLYYDITSRQSIAQLFEGKHITRQWMSDFLWSIQRLRQELSRYLLDSSNVLWYPQQIYQDLDKEDFSFIYLPYYQGDTGFQRLMEYLVEHIDYQDEPLVEYVYRVYEQYENAGEAYLQEKIFEDAKILDAKTESVSAESSGALQDNLPVEEEMRVETATEERVKEKQVKEKQGKEKQGFFSFLEGKRKKEKEARADYQQSMQLSLSGYAVAETTSYGDEEWGKTIYIEETPSQKEIIHRLLTPEGRLLSQLDRPILTIGKKSGEVDVVVEDISISRIHARIIREKEDCYLEDMNSTNGTFKNGLRMQPYEKRKLEEGDEIKFGKKTFIYR